MKITDETIKTQRLEKIAEANNMSAEDLLKQIKDWGTIGNSRKYGGEFTDKSKFGMLKEEFDVKGRERKTKNLSEYAKEEDLSEREDEDIYAHYINEMKKSKEE